MVRGHRQVFKAVDLAFSTRGHMTASAARVLRLFLASLLVGAALMGAATTAARAETRALKLYYIHTGEKAEIVFKKNGRYVKSGLDKLNRFLRDWRRNEPTKMDPRLFDLVWEAYRQVGGRDYIHVVSAYRSPATNKMLRRTRGGQAKKSQHMYGRAMDFFIPGVKLSKLRAVAMKLQGGGVGYYPRSGSPFVHLDVAGVRAWPRMSRKELVRLFPDGKTLHLPADGKPLKGYQQAPAEAKRRKGRPVIIDDKPSGSGSDGGKSLLASLFGGGDEDEGAGDAPAATAALRAAPKVAVGAQTAPAARPAAPAPVQAAPAAPERPEQPEQQPVATPETILASLPRNAVPVPRFAPRIADAGQPVDVAVNREETPAGPEVAMNVPVPRWRPDDVPSGPARTGDVIAEALAASGDDTGAVIASVAPTERPRNDSAAILAALAGDTRPEIATATTLAGVPLPVARPEADRTVEVAALPVPRPVFRQSAPNEGKAARLGASPRSEAARARSPEERLAAVLGGVRTTEKSGRPTAAMAKPDPRPVIRPVEPDSARWALSAAASVQPPAKPRVSESLRAKPQEVIAIGFARDDMQRDHRRFTGNAVTFLSVVRFRDAN